MSQLLYIGKHKSKKKDFIEKQHEKMEIISNFTQKSYFKSKKNISLTIIAYSL